MTATGATTDKTFARPHQLGAVAARYASLRTQAARHRVLFAAYAALGFLLVVFCVSLSVLNVDQSSQITDSWFVGAFDLLCGVMCLSALIGRRHNRGVVVLLSLSIFAWGSGDALLAALSAHGDVPSPSLADIPYLCSYLLAYLTVVSLLRTHVQRLQSASWLDGAIAGLGAAALCACFIFQTVVSSAAGNDGTSALGVAVNLAYPLGDVVLLILVVGGTAMLPGRRGTQWLLLAAAFIVNAVGDTFNVVGVAGHESHLSIVLDGIAWPASLYLLSIAGHLRPRRANPIAYQSPAGFVLPGLGAVSGIAVLLAASFGDVPPYAVGLATATLIVAGVRLGWSATALRKLTDKRHRQSVTDELTGLGNRRHLFHVLDSFFADQSRPKAERRELSLLFMDLDRFKTVNDAFGHGAGDELLRQLGPRLLNVLRASDTLVRLGGDEFAVILFDSPADVAASVAQRMIDAVEEPFMLSSVSVTVGASIGIALAHVDATTTEELLHRADLAMFRAKAGAAADSSVMTYHRGIDDTADKMQLATDLKAAIDGNQLELYYQPQVDLHTNQPYGYEALLRWTHPRLGPMAPLAFLPLAEDAGLMPALTAWVIDTGLAQCALWRDDDATSSDITLSLNVSVSNLLDPTFVSSIRRALSRRSVPASALIIEITETTVIGDFDACQNVIAALRFMGVGVSIDDFGAGVTSLAYLAGLAVSELKLDRSFIARCASGTAIRDLALIRGTVDLAHALHMRVVAEGVENAEVLALLVDSGCDAAQGYHLGRPAAAINARPAPEAQRTSGDAVLRVVQPLHHQTHAS